MLLKLTSNVSIDGIEHKAGTVINTVEKGVSSECLLTWKWAVETNQEATPEATPQPVELPVELVQPIEPTEPVQPVEQPVEPVAPRPRKSRR